jgi:hypothetical protein
MPFPLGYKQEKEDCFRCALAYILDWSPRSVPFYMPGEGNIEDNSDFWGKYKAWAKRRLKLTLLTFGEECVDEFLKYDERMWVASVPSGRDDPVKHAVVMKGAKLEYDPAGIRKQKPKRIYAAIVMVDNYKVHDDGTCSFVY